jgi:hypothetical protein
MEDWTRVLSRDIRPAPTVWGLHNYRGMNRFSAESTDLFLRLVQGEVWLTETGGIVTLMDPGGVVRQPFDEQRAADALRFTLSTATARADRIRQVYVYNWSAPAGFSTFDAGLIRSNTTERPALAVLRSHLGVPAPPPVHPGDRLVVGPGGVRGTAESARPRLRVGGVRINGREKKPVRVELSCFGARSCRAVLRITPERREKRGRAAAAPLLARGTVAVWGRGQARRLRLTKAGRRWLGRRGAVGKRVAVTIAPAADGTAAVARDLAVLRVGRPPRKARRPLRR